MSGSGSKFVIRSNAVTFGYYLTVFTNFILVPALYWTLCDFEYGFFSFFYYLFLWFNSLSYHSCDTFQLMLCPANVLFFTQRLDHFTAEYGIPYLAIRLSPVFPRFWVKIVVYLIVISIHYLIQISYLIAPGFEYLALGWQILWAGIFVYVYWTIWRNELDETDAPKIATILWWGALGLTFFALDELDIYPWAHSVWHACVFIAICLAEYWFPERELLRRSKARWERYHSGQVASKSV
jgi:Protein of unknown function (DUF3522)